MKKMLNYAKTREAKIDLPAKFAKSKRLLLSLFVLFFMGIGVVTAQTQVRGTVVDEFGEPVIGATILIQGTGQGTTTDAEGNFTLSAPAGGTLLVSFIGYTTQAVAVAPNVRVELEPDVEMLEEVVVTALGLSRERRALGYSVTELRGEDIIRSSVTNPINALQGRVPGVQINMGASGPQSTQRILIRGHTSLTGQNQPIFVVDGVIIENDLGGAGGGWRERDFGNALKKLNPDDFESVTVLKGAAATALYGSRAANGVILITTKQGRRQQGLGINFSHTQQWENVYRFPDFQNEFGIGSVPAWSLLDDGRENRSIPLTSLGFGPRFDGNPFTVANPDGAEYNGIWMARPDNIRALYQTGRFINTSVAVSGGNETGSFRLSYSNLQQTGITLNNEFTRNNFALNASQNLGRLVTVRAGLTYVQSEGRNPTFQGEHFSPVYDFSRWIPRMHNTHYWRNNYWSANRDGWNPDDPWRLTSRFFEFLENNQIQREETYRGNAEVLINFTDWLRFTLRGTMNRSYRTFEDKRLAYTNSLVGTEHFGGSHYAINRRENLQYSGLGMLTAMHTVGDFSFSASVAAERWHQDQSFHNSWADGGLRAPGVFQLTNSVNQARTDAFSRIYQRRINSVFGLINASWRDQVYLDITGRNDWSSTLMFSDGTGNVSYFYPSIGSSWVISETFRGRMPHPMSFARVRASYAIVGSDTGPYTITNPGVFTYRTSFDDIRFGTGRFPIFDFVNQVAVSRDIKPEMQHAVELGFDVRFFNNRVGLDATYYRTNTRNQIIRLATPAEMGINERIINAGDIRNQGFEVLLTGAPIRRRDMSWDLGLNFTRNRSKVISLYEGMTRYQLGGDAGNVTAWATVGGAFGEIYTNYAFIRNEEGRKLLNASGGYVRAGEATRVGNFQPSFLGGFTSDFRWRNFGFHAVIDARFGGQIWSASFNEGMWHGNLASSLTGRPGHGGLPRNIGTEESPRIVYDGMIPDGVFQEGVTLGGTDVSGWSFQRAVDEGLINPLAASQYYFNRYSWGSGIREASILDLSWVALRELSFTYDLPRSWTDRLHLQGAAIGVTMRNVGYLYNSLPDNLHPEGLRSASAVEFREGGGNVFARNIGVRLNVTF
jgi:iron complex outermembrane receptor protein